MKHRLHVHSLSVVLLLLISALLFASCGTEKKDPADAEQDFKTAYEKYRMLDDNSAKADLMDEFASNYPDTEISGRAIGLVVYNRHYVNQDYQGALQYLDEQLGMVTNPSVRKSVKLQKLEALVELGRESELTALAQDLLDSPEALTPAERLEVLGAATKSGAWQLADRVSDILMQELKESDDPYSRSSVLMKKGWILHNLGRTDEALGFFEEAGSIGPRNFARYSEYPVMELEYQWASTLLAAGKPEEALETFEVRALFVKEENKALQDSYQELLKKAYLASGNDEASFEDYKTLRKAELSEQVPEFSAPDLNGRTLSFSEIKGDKATLLVFWFPT